MSLTGLVGTVTAEKFLKDPKTINIINRTCSSFTTRTNMNGPNLSIQQFIDEADTFVPYQIEEDDEPDQAPMMLALPSQPSVGSSSSSAPAAAAPAQASGPTTPERVLPSEAKAPTTDVGAKRKSRASWRVPLPDIPDSHTHTLTPDVPSPLPPLLPSPFPLADLPIELWSLILSICVATFDSGRLVCKTWRRDLEVDEQCPFRFSLDHMPDTVVRSLSQHARPQGFRSWEFVCSMQCLACTCWRFQWEFTLPELVS